MGTSSLRTPERNHKESPVAPAAVAHVVEQLLALGCHEISLGDTIGVGTPGSTRAMLDAVKVRLL